MTIEEHINGQIDYTSSGVSNPNAPQYHSFGFDYIYGPKSAQKHLYENTAKPAVISVL